jgi:hypothetical protein
MKLFFLLVPIVALFGISCERHEFDGEDGTKRLHKHHGSHDKDVDEAEKTAH